MRYVVTFETPIEVGNEFEKDPKAGEVLARLVKQAKSEAVYFSTSRRALTIIANAENAVELAKTLIPFWHTLKVYPQVEPVITLDEFITALPEYQQVVKDL